jgi:hypothetical protein
MIRFAFGVIAQYLDDPAIRGLSRAMTLKHVFELVFQAR